MAGKRTAPRMGSTQRRRAQGEARGVMENVLAKRLTREEIDALPALITTKELADIEGISVIYAQKQCQAGGILEHCAIKAGRDWRISKAKALKALGLE